MNIYKIYQNVVGGYDVYDSAVVAALSAEKARFMHPNGKILTDYEGITDTWTAPANVNVEYLGKASRKVKSGVIVASFNAG